MPWIASARVCIKAVFGHLKNISLCKLVDMLFEIQYSIGLIDRLTDWQRDDGQTEGWTDGRTDGPMEGQTDWLPHEWMNEWQANWINSLIYVWLTDWLIDWLIDWQSYLILIYWKTNWLILFLLVQEAALGEQEVTDPLIPPIPPPVGLAWDHLLPHTQWPITQPILQTHNHLSLVQPAFLPQLKQIGSQQKCRPHQVAI